MGKYQVRVWQEASVQWGYSDIEASSPEEAIKKVKSGNYESSPTVLDTEAVEDNDWEDAEAVEQWWEE